ncbi:MAG TPA: hypothetical protein VHR42_07655 [Clostridia bacterium]|nr:hypothetical protein [Clostridia bacterium]
MKLSRQVSKGISTGILILVLIFIYINFNTIFTKLNYNALAVTDNQKDETINLPTQINFLSSDKKEFVEYCSLTFDVNLSDQSGNRVFTYYGAINGYRFYRLQLNCIPCDSAFTEENIGGYTFTSPCYYRPNPTGLYIIGDDGVYTLKEAYEKGLINISNAYSLYQKKNIT